MIPMPSTAIIDLRTAFEVLASVSGAIAVWAQQQAQAPDPVGDLTQRLRQPIRWGLSHPVQAVRRLVKKRLLYEWPHQ